MKSEVKDEEHSETEHLEVDTSTTVPYINSEDTKDISNSESDERNNGRIYFGISFDIRQILYTFIPKDFI